MIISSVGNASVKNVPEEDTTKKVVHPKHTTKVRPYDYMAAELQENLHSPIMAQPMTSVYS
jgi:hypothetical protein